MRRVEEETLLLIKAAIGISQKTFGNDEFAEIDDIEKLYKVFKSHKIENILFYALKNVTEVPPQIRIRLENDHKKAILRGMQQAAEIDLLFEKFADNGIRYMPMKGILMKKLYPSADMRSMADTDVLIDKENIERAGEIAEELGYECFEKGVNHDTYHKRPYVAVELHRALIASTADRRIHNYFGTWERAYPKPGNGYEWCLSDEDFYIFMIGHIAKHFCRGGIGIRAILDIYVYNREKGDTLNREYIYSELNKCGLETFARQFEQLAGVWFDECETNDFFDTLTQFLFSSQAYGTPEHDVAYEIISSSINNFAGAKTTNVIKLIFPNMKRMEMSTPWVKGKPLLLPAAWIVRIIRALLVRRKKISRLKAAVKVSEQNTCIQSRLYKELGIDKDLKQEV